MKVALVASALAGLLAVLLPVAGLVGTVGAVAAIGDEGSTSGAGASAGQLAVEAAALDIPLNALVAYRLAAGSCPGLRWGVLAAIGRIESDHGRSTLPGVTVGANQAGAEGPMQLLPATFAEYAVDAGDGDVASPYDLVDAVLAAARLLCADGGGTAAGLRGAVFSYNHDWTYVDDVLAWADRYEQGLAAAAPAEPSASTASPGSADAAQLGGVAAEWALLRVGLPYEWGGTGPGSFDCSGLVLRAWEAAGILLPRVAADQFGAGIHVPVADASVGDLLFFATDPRDPTTIHHVAIYLGGGLMVEAPHPGASVRVVAVYPDGLVPVVTRPAR
ncbi:MAG: NlpC/P60 family protein [Acidimicrobiales bacterium]